MILTFLPGENGELVLRGMSKREQYEAGYQAGKELKKLHALCAPDDCPPWYTVKKKKSDQYLQKFNEMELDKNIKYLLNDTIKRYEEMMIDRPNRFQHDDFHPANLIIRNNQFAGIIDFQRMDWGDLIHDLQKVGFFTKSISGDFAKGNIDGYHDGQEINAQFWELYTLYSAMHIVSAIVWSYKNAEKEFSKIKRQSYEVIEDHDLFNSTIPKWYRE